MSRIFTIGWPAIACVLFVVCGACKETAASGSKVAPGAAVGVTAGAVAPPACARYAEPSEVGRFGAERLRELSGLAASRRHPGLLWGHVDHGKSKARIFAINEKGRHVATYRLKGVDPIDTEDIAIAPCAAAGQRAALPCIYLGDVGDNSHSREQVVVYRVEEPDSLPSPPPPGAKVDGKKIGKRKVEHLRLRYPAAPGVDARRRAQVEHPNVEAMVVLADTRIVLLSKRKDGTSDVFRVAAAATGLTTAERLGSLDLRVPPGNVQAASPTTAADLSADGRWLAMRTYGRLFVFDAGDALTLPAAQAAVALSRAPRTEIKAGVESQGEAVCWDRGEGLWHASEIGKGEPNAPLWRIACAAE